MAISPIELNGMVSRSQDIQILKHNEDNRGTLEQNNIVLQTRQHNEEKQRQVNEADNAERNSEKYDAKEKGKNSYEGNKGTNSKKKQNESDGKVIIKKSGSFDIKI